MQLIYRAQIYHCALPSAPVTVAPQTVNWRYQIAGQRYGGTIVPKRTVAPKAVNWRYQMALG